MTMHINNSTAHFSKFAHNGTPQERPVQHKTDAKAQAPVDVATVNISKAVGDAVASAVSGAQEPENPMKGAKSIPGMFKVYEKDNQRFLSIKPEQLGKPFFFSANTSKSLGEKRLVGSEMGDSYLATFRRVDDAIQLVALHTENYAEPNSPQAKFVSEDYSDSLISSTGVLAGSTDDAILVSADDLLLRDLANYGPRMNYAYKSNFGLDPHNTHFTQVDNHKEQTSFAVQAHFKGSPSKNGPSTTPKHDSVLTEFRYNFLQLPEEMMQPREADERIGHFVTTRKDYTSDEGDGLNRMVNRWRLEKADPSAEVSKPVEPITYWIANNVPKEYRKAVREGILEWNKAFEAAGFEDAIKVRQQRSNAKFDTMDARHASVRWYTAADVGSAVGPSHVDPRTGEILDADIRMADVFGRGAKRFLKDNPPQESEHAHHDHEHHGHIHGPDGSCNYQAHAANEYDFANSLLEARGVDEKASEELAQAYVKDVVMHEVGHTLGFRHNFKGSTAFTSEQLQDAEFTKENGLGSSVMDYHPYNLAAPGETQGEYVMSTLGAYDYLAVKYAYGEFDEHEEADKLNEIAKKTTTDPQLAYETDEAADDMDPEVSRFDLGKNPLAFAGKQINLANELWNRAQTQELPEGTSYKELTRAFRSGLNKVASGVRLANRYVGGVTLRRDRAGTGNPIYQPIPAEKQKEAVGLITSTMFSPDSFKFDPAFTSRLAQNRFGNWGDQNYDVGASVLRIQSRALRSLFDDSIAQRMISNPEKLPADAPTYKLSEMYQSVQGSIWSEVSDNKEISQARRDLQREYIEVLGDKLSDESKAPGEAKSLLRYLSGRLQKQIDAAAQDGMSLETLAHLEDCSQNLDKILNPEE